MIITLDDVVEEVGEFKRHRQDEYEFQCPYCAKLGGDRHEDNLKFNTRKNILYCFANPEHSKQIYRNIVQKKLMFEDFDYEQTLFGISSNPTTLSDEDIERFKFYALDCRDELLQSDFLLDLLYQCRGITKDTVENVFLGYDNNAECWVIPTVEYNSFVNYDNKVVGFEYRPIDFSKHGLRRSKNTPTPIAMINEYTEKTECLAIVEGYFDGYVLYQYLKEKNQIEKYHIVTCSNGVQSLLKKIDTINFTKYKQSYLCIDNDDASRPIAKEIIARYPFIHDICLPSGCKDFNEYYLKCIKNKNNT